MALTIPVWLLWAAGGVLAAGIILPVLWLAWLGFCFRAFTKSSGWLWR